MSSKNFNNYIISAIKLLLGMLFIYTATGKLMHLDIFQMRLEQMPYISPLASSLKWLVPFAELVIVGLLLIGKYRALGMYASFILLGLFTMYIMAVLRFNEHVPCSCGGVLSALSWRDHILFNGAFMLLALTAIRLSRKGNKDKPQNQNTT
ncbi:MauE/DoxX family redox-associated membrane protein [Flagellimonas okinawensis]|uniref:Methylamine utilisation protein MauE domain-containing protein n=1 Tax=Flagellimonas okinawensis TaxID=3031324 RepID=A0ABT5XT10_9FLAO|nr:MauE/DoxX family redox-associated membrane protein [[Muricauda] okinawensis]MDF0709053.1 hypothetical protein [[Muricauda] okinawensis]